MANNEASSLYVVREIQAGRETTSFFLRYEDICLSEKIKKTSRSLCLVVRGLKKAKDR